MTEPATVSSYIEATVAGTAHRIIAIDMLPERQVADWRGLIAKAEASIGPVSTGIGFLGSPGWAIGGALLVGALEHAATSAKQQVALESLNRATEIAETFRWLGLMIPVGSIDRLDVAAPLAWRSLHAAETLIDLRSMTRAESAAYFARTGLSASDAVDWKISRKVEQAFALATDEFLTVITDDSRRIKIRWQSVDSYRVVVGGADYVVTQPG